MEGSSSKSDSSGEENQYLDMIIESSLKKSKASTKEKSSKGNYKLNLSADLMGANSSKAFLSPFFRIYNVTIFLQVISNLINRSPDAKSAGRRPIKSQNLPSTLQRTLLFATSRNA